MPRKKSVPVYITPQAAPQPAPKPDPAPKPTPTLKLNEALARKGQAFLRFGEFGQNWETPHIVLSEAEHDRVARCMRAMRLDVLLPRSIRDGVLEIDKHMGDLVIVRGPAGEPTFILFWPKIVLEG